MSDFLVATKMTKIYTEAQLHNYGSAGWHIRLITWCGNNHISQGFNITPEMECLKKFMEESHITAQEWLLMAQSEHKEQK